MKFILEFELEGQGNGWTDRTYHLHRGSVVSIGRGINGRGPVDLVAGTGVATWQMLNLKWGSLVGDIEEDASLTGRPYTLGDDAAAGWGVGTPCRWSIDLEDDDDNPTQRVIWTGEITSFSPTVGERRPGFVKVEARDYMEVLSTHQLSGLSVLQDAKEHEVFNEIINAVPKSPRRTEVDQSGIDTYPVVFDDLRDESGNPRRELQRLVQSSLGDVFIKADGTLVYQTRRHRIGNRNADGGPADVYNLYDSDFLRSNEPKVQESRDGELNRVTVSIYPREHTENLVVLWTLQRVQRLSPYGELVFEAQYKDPDERTNRVAALDVVSPVKGVDYTAASIGERSSIANRNNDISVTAENSGNASIITVRNLTGANIFITKLQIRGRPILTYDELTVEARDQDDIDIEGEKGFTTKLPFHDDIEFADQVARHLQIQYGSHRLSVNTVRLRLGSSNDYLPRALEFIDREIGDVIGIHDTASGISSNVYLQHIKFLSDRKGAFDVEWQLTSVQPVPYWICEDDIFGVIGDDNYVTSDSTGFHSDSADGDCPPDSAATRASMSILAAHLDVGHGDHEDAGTSVAHVDTDHADAGTNFNVAHVDHNDTTHGDVDHDDVLHEDADHEDIRAVPHKDVEFVDVPAQTTVHIDVAFVDIPSVTTHTDALVDHMDVAHVDTAHVDTHTDQHGDTHIDMGTDPPEPESPPHMDTHIDLHNDTHSDAAHGDVRHVDSATHHDHTDTTLHGDVDFADVESEHTEHGDIDFCDVPAIPHVDIAHLDMAHRDTPHTDTTTGGHIDIAAVHGDVAHSDVNHGDTPHEDVAASHADSAHIDID